MQTAKLNGINPEACLKDAFTKNAEEHPINRTHKLLPWHWQTLKPAAA
jgi:hypothetical protein